MSVTRQTIHRWVREGESQTSEFKLRLPPDSIVGAHLAALANASGGHLLIGVNEKAELVGLSEEDAERAVRRLRAVAESLLPNRAEVGAIRVGSGRIVYAVVEPAPQHLAPVVTADGSVYVRTGSTSKKLDSSEESRLLRGTPAPPQSAQRTKVFVAMSFRVEQDPALVDYYRAIQRAVAASDLPFDLVRIDLVQGDFEISQQSMEEIDACSILIADFTLSPANVYFELGYARGKGIGVIQTARQGTVLEFDVRNWRTEFYRNATELEEKIRPALEAAYGRVTGQA